MGRIGAGVEWEGERTRELRIEHEYGYGHEHEYVYVYVYGPKWFFRYWEQERCVLCLGRVGSV